MTRRYLTAGRRRELEAALSQRDFQALVYVASLRFVSGAQLARLCFGGRDQASARAARRALLRLVDLDVLARLPRSIGGVRSGSAGFVYHLGIAGQRIAVARGWQAAGRARRSRTPGSLFVGHALAVAELHTQIVEAARTGRFELLEASAEPACWRSFNGSAPRPLTLKPDTYLRLGIDSYEDSYFVEVDRGTEGSGAIQRQLKLYRDYHAMSKPPAAFSQACSGWPPTPSESESSPST